MLRRRREGEKTSWSWLRKEAQVREKESQALGRKPRGELMGGKTRNEREHSEERETLLQGREKTLR